MNINKLLETIKDTSRDYVGTNGCLYQDISREELNLIVNEIKRLNKELEEKEAILGGIQQLEAEIERLNNIINNLWEYLEKAKEVTTGEYKNAIKDIIHFIQPYLELKEQNNE